MDGRRTAWLLAAALGLTGPASWIAAQPPPQVQLPAVSAAASAGAGTNASSGKPPAGAANGTSRTSAAGTSPPGNGPPAGNGPRRPQPQRGPGRLPAPPRLAVLQSILPPANSAAPDIQLAPPDGQTSRPVAAEVVPPPSGKSLAERAANEEPLELVEFRDVPLSEVARLLSDQSGLNIVPSVDAAKVLISLYLRNVRPLVAIDALTKSHGLFYREDPANGIIRIYTTKEYEADLNSFREEQTEVFTLLYPNPIDVAIAIRGTFGTRVLLNYAYTDQQKGQDLQLRFQRLTLVDQFNRQSSSLVGGTGTGGGYGGGIGGYGGGGTFGGGAGGLGGGLGGMGMGGMGMGGMGMGGMGMGGMGMGGFGGMGQMGMGGMGQQGYGQFGQAGQAPPRLQGLTAEQIQGLESATGASGLDQAIDELLRSRNAQIFVSVVPRNNQIVIRTADVRTMQRIREMISQLDVPTPLVLLEVKVLSLDLTDNFTSIFDYQFDDGHLTAGGFTSGNILPPIADTSPAGLTRDQVLSTPTVPPVPAAITAPNQNATFQIVSANFRARMQMLETKNRVTELAAPLLLTANNEASRIFIGQQVPIVVGYGQSGLTTGTSVGTTTAVQAAPQTQLENVGQGLVITPNINADRTVTLRISQQNSMVIPNGATIPVVNAEGTTLNLSIDIVQTNVVSGTIVAKDGLTVALGGLIQETLTDNRAYVPILGKLPIVGILFRNQTTGKTRTEIVVMVRPYVFNTPQESASLSSDLIRDLSLHPKAPLAIGTMSSFAPQEILTANPPHNPLQTIFRFHSIDPAIY